MYTHHGLCMQTYIAYNINNVYTYYHTHMQRNIVNQIE